MKQETIKGLEGKFFSLTKKYQARNGLFEYTKNALSEMKEHHLNTYLHALRVAIMAALLAEEFGEKDPKPELYGGANHDIGKLEIPVQLLYSFSITKKEYETIKTHAEQGAKNLKAYLFVSYVVGMHHCFQKEAYGIDRKDLEGLDLNEGCKKRVLTAAINVALADYFDALMVRKSKLLSGKTGEAKNLISEEYQGEGERIDFLFQNQEIEELMRPFIS